MIRALIFAAALCIAAPALADPAPVPGQLVNAEAIAPFLARLAAPPAQPLSIVQIGDSHTAGDMVVQGWRQRWQAEYGAAGRGMSPVGRPYQGYLTWGVTARQSPEWQTSALFGRAHQANGVPLGLTGFTASAAHAGATLALRADNADFAFDRFGLCGVTGPDRGALDITLGSGLAPVTADFAAPAPGFACFDWTTPDPVALATLTTRDDRPVALTSWTTARSRPGITLSSLGVVGARLGHLARADDQLVARELAEVHPDLLVIAFGTNEGFDPALKADESETVLRTQIARLRRLLGHAVPILLIGPPDAASSRAEVALPALADTVACGGGWAVPGHLAQVRALYLRLARELNVAVWDWQGAMGGPCSTMAWVAAGMQRADHVHFTMAGGQVLGRALADDLDRAAAAVAK